MDANRGAGDWGGAFHGLLHLGCAAIAWLLVYGFRRHGSRLPDRPNDDGTIEDRSRFMALTTMLLAAMSLIATVFVGAAAVAAGGCQ